MFPLGKLASSRPRRGSARSRASSRAWRSSSAARLSPDRAYAAGLLALLADDPAAGELCPRGRARRSRRRRTIPRCSARAERPPPRPAARPAGGALRVGPARARDGQPGPLRSRVFPMAVFLEDIRSPFNVGSIFRTAEAFGAERILLSPRTPLPSHPRAAEDGARRAGGAALGDGGACAARRDREGDLRPRAGRRGHRQLPLPRARDRARRLGGAGPQPGGARLADRGLGRVSIPQAGAKRSLNVSVAFGILMQRWYSALRGAAPLRLGRRGTLVPSSTNRTPFQGWKEKYLRSL